ncbi:penicillin acylase family protein [Paludibacterium paludis]|uniref:7-beta-(4-carbaxybutanamido)cephalosporanic acid acylase n=1 Tax=Paludibacterium paludis TaxID=1225769 RepID=A0A918U8R4_9NEIS|nr:penicillin acylase family protein [Paludibacterium paludis]GGY08468.1 7-beta-(4-carbaxybutanamido)cephalosporanic acid acylase [Paludibacterium paludis]
MKHFARAVAVVITLLSLSACEPDDHAGKPRGSQTLWDSYGVPHIYAWRADSMAYAFGRAQMRMHPELLLRLYAQGRGRGAEYYGPVFEGGEPFPTDMVEVDTLVRTMGFPSRASLWWQRQSPRMREYLEAFVAGINDQAARETLSPAARAVLPVSAEDVMAHTLRIFFGYLSGSMTTGAANCSLVYPDPVSTPVNLIGGSNGWALGPAKTVSGNAMLLANPHLLWGGTHTWFEAHFASPEYSIYGATLVGLPVMRIGFNERLGWVHTVNSQDGCDLYELKTSADRYLLDGVPRDYETRREILRVRQPDGSFREQPLTLRRAVHGPVFDKDGKRYAMRIVGVDQLQTPGVLEQWWDMAQSKDFAQFRRTVGRLHNPYHNIIYADAARNIWAVFGGLTPRRSGGDAAFWAEPVDGGRGDLIWRDALRLDELPQAVNPVGGWVQNSNSVPWYMSKPALDHGRFPAYLSPLTIPLLREQRGIELIEQTPRFTLDTLMRAKHDTRSLMADRVLDPLIAFAGASGNADLVAAAQALRVWDRRSDAQSRGAALFAAWLAVSGGEEGLRFLEEPDPAKPYGTPAGLRDPEHALTKLGEAVGLFRQAGLPLDVAYGDVYRFRRGKPGSARYVDEPANGASESLGGFRTFGYLDDQDGRLRAIFGDTFTVLVEFGNPVTAKVINTYGNSSNPQSPYYGDQLPMASRNQMRDALLSRQEVERGAVRSEVFWR